AKALLKPVRANARPRASPEPGTLPPQDVRPLRMPPTRTEQETQRTESPLGAQTRADPRRRLPKTRNGQPPPNQDRRRNDPQNDLKHRTQRAEESRALRDPQSIPRLEHLIWECSALTTHRREALGNLAPDDRPANMGQWTHPTGDSDRRTRILRSLLDYLSRGDLRV
ncbi:unnamed protein product, partial [Ixodes hexagonus]